MNSMICVLITDGSASVAVARVTHRRKTMTRAATMTTMKLQTATRCQTAPERLNPALEEAPPPPPFWELMAAVAVVVNAVALKAAAGS